MTPAQNEARETLAGRGRFPSGGDVPFDVAQDLIAEALARAGGDGWRTGDRAEYTAAVRPIRVTLLDNVEGWWRVQCSDGSMSIVRPSCLRRLPAAPDMEGR